MIRSAVEAKLNLLDLYAVEEAVRIKEKMEGTERTQNWLVPEANSRNSGWHTCACQPL